MTLDVRPYATLEYADPAGRPVVQTVFDTPCVIGRSNDECDVCIDSPKVSRKHCVIHVLDGLKLTDLGSTNGTYLNGVRLQPREDHPLRDGDRIAIGGVEMRFQVRELYTRRGWTRG